MWDTWDTIFTATATDNLFRYTNTLFRYTNTLFWRINSLFRGIDCSALALALPLIQLHIGPCTGQLDSYISRPLIIQVALLDLELRNAYDISPMRTRRRKPRRTAQGAARRRPVLLLSLLACSPVLFASILALVVSLGR